MIFSFHQFQLKLFLFLIGLRLIIASSNTLLKSSIRPNCDIQSEEDDSYDILFKLVVVGDSGVGKTNLLTRFNRNEFNIESKATIGVEFIYKTVKIEDKVVKAMIWDTAGQERFRAITGTFYRGAAGALIVFDISNRESFENAQFWLSELRQKTSPDILILLVGNKYDLKFRRSVSSQEATQFADQNGIFYTETSALDTFNVNNAFTGILNELFKISCAKLEASKKTQAGPISGTRITIESKPAPAPKQQNPNCCQK